MSTKKAVRLFGLSIWKKDTTKCRDLAWLQIAAHGGAFSSFGFVANSGNRNEVGIGKKICVGYKGVF